MLEEFSFSQCLRMIFAAAAVLFLPGYVLQKILLWRNSDWIQSLCRSLGLSISLLALISQVLFFLPWEPPVYAFLGSFLLLTIFFFGFLLGNPFSKRFDGSHLWILALTILALFWRLFQVRGLVLPSWVDPLHHVLITRRILEIGGLPESLSPYMPVPFYYHFSFHVVSACFAGLAGISPVAAVFVVGQVLNALMGLSVYRLVMSLWAEKRWALAAAALVTFYTQMPAYYATWGRYTLLSGLLLLPLALAEALEWSQTRKKACLGRLAFLTGGLLLTHYFAAILLALFLGLWLLEEWFSSVQEKRWNTLSFLTAAGSPILGLILAAPWLWRMWSYAQEVVQLGAVGVGNSVDQAYFPDYKPYLWYLLGPWRVRVLEAVSLVALLFVWREKGSRLFAAWAVLLGLGAIPWGIRLEPFRPDHFVIAAFLPVSVLAIALLRRGCSFLAGRLGEKMAYRIVDGLVAAALAVGVWQTAVIINPATVLAEKEDLAALRWLEEHVAREARFLVNTAPWEWGTFRGVDGGAWILPLTGRWSVAPPPLHASGNREYALHTREVAQKVSQLYDCDDSFRKILLEENITHLYLGVHPGSLTVEKMDGCPILETVYRKGSVRIYSVKDKRFWAQLP